MQKIISPYVSGNQVLKRCTTPLSTLSMEKTCGPSLISQMSCLHIKGLCLGDPRKREGWNNGSWGKMTRNYEKVAIEKDTEFVVNWGTIEDIAHNCLHKYSPHSQLMLLHNQPSHLKNHRLYSLKTQFKLAFTVHVIWSLSLYFHGCYFVHLISHFWIISITDFFIL